MKIYDICLRNLDLFASTRMCPIIEETSNGMNILEFCFIFGLKFLFFFFFSDSDKDKACVYFCVKTRHILSLTRDVYRIRFG